MAMWITVKCLYSTVDGISEETLQAVGGFPLTADIFCTWYDLYMPTRRRTKFESTLDNVQLLRVFLVQSR